MFWRSALRFSRTLTFRLTLWYAGLLATTCLAGFLSTYLVFSRFLLFQIDSDLSGKAKEFEALYKKGDLRALSSEFRREAKSKGIEKVFYALLDAEGNLLASSEGNSWSNTVILKGFNRQVSTAQIRSDSLRERTVRVLFKPVENQKSLFLAQSLGDFAKTRKRYLQSFVAVLLASLLLGVPLSFFLSKKAMAGVERVARTAHQIRDGNLEKRVPIRKEGLEIEKLAGAFNNMMDQMEKLVRELKEVTDNVAHDLRSPVTRIRGAAETTLLTGKTVEDYQAMAAGVIEECDRLIGIINTTLEIAKANSGLCELKKERLDARAIVAEAADLFEPVAKEKSIHLEKRLPSEKILLEGDRSKIQRAFSNLLDNAIKFTQEKGKVAVSARKEGEAILLEVEDNGVGIPKEEIGRIFERFYRGEKSRTTPGNGLGLSLAQAIAKVHGGKVLVESSLGRGSKFTLVLPAFF